MLAEKAIIYAQNLLLKLKEDYNQSFLDKITLTAILFELGSARDLKALKQEINQLCTKYPVLIEFAFKDKMTKNIDFLEDLSHTLQERNNPILNQEVEKILETSSKTLEPLELQTKINQLIKNI